MNFKQTSPGVSFIEVMTATVIISIACIGLLMGVVHARSELHSLQVKERATEELLNYMEYWKGRVADGNLSPSERAGDYDGDDVYLVGGRGIKNSIQAKLYYDLDRLDRFNDFGSTDFTRYELECWIRWNDRFITPPGSYAGDVVQERRLSTVMTEFEI
jgi:Tfp pilus assembly protein PilV